MAVGGIFQLTGVVNVQGLSTLENDLARATAIGNLFSDALEKAFGIVETGAGRALNAFKDFVQDSIQEAMKIERIKQTFAGLYDNTDMADAKVAKIRQYARASLNTSDNLLEAGTIAEMGGLNFTGRMMKDLDVLSRGNNERLRQLTEQLVRAGTGSNLGRVMQVLSRSGINYNDLVAEGIKVTPGHHIEANGEQFVNAILNIAERKFPKLGEYLARSVQVKFVDLQDSWSQLLDKFGQMWFPLIGRIIDSIGPFINFLTDTGEIEHLGKAFADAFGALFNMGGGQRGLEAFLAYVIATFELLPNIITNVGRTIATVFHAIVQEATNELKQFIPFFVGMANIVRGMMVNLANLDKFFGVESGADRDILKNMSQPLKVPEFKDLPDLFGQILATLGGKNIPTGAIGDRQKQILEGLDYYKKMPHPALADPGGGKLFNPLHQDEELAAAKQTAANTAKISAAMEPFKRFALGGGERGRIGVALAERYGNGQHNFTVSGTGSVHLDRYMTEQFNDMHQSWRRSALGQ